MAAMTEITSEAHAEATEWGRRAGNSGLSMKVSPYAKTDPEYRYWFDAWVRATEQRINHGGASPH